MLYKDYNHFMQYQYDITLGLHEHILNSVHTTAIQTLRIIPPQEYYYHTKMHLAVIANAIYFNAPSIFYHYSAWRYRTYYYRGINLAFCEYENRHLKEILSFYLEPTTFLRLEPIYALIEKHHTLLKNDAPKKLQCSTSPLGNKLYHYALKGERFSLEEYLEQNCNCLETFCRFFDTQLSPIIQRIGQEWEYNQITIAQEHIFSATLEEAILAHFQKLTIPPKDNTIQIALATPPNEHHGLGIKIAKSILERLGYRVMNLGNDLPISQLQEFIETNRPHYLLTP
ncbi:MAG: hypothetical protein JXQ76_04385, partial [Campylobacterales bacterium]|nr:hypothetical protein [Campylobacterales bacterium]